MRWSGAKAFANLMTEASRSRGEYFFADSGYFAEVVDKPDVLGEQLRKLYKLTSHKGNAALAQRLMYGTDWEMILVEGARTEGYLEQFIRIFDDLDRDNSLGSEGQLSDRFFGLNAANYLTLQKVVDERPNNRSRLEKFYSAAKVPKPDWAEKVRP